MTFYQAHPFLRLLLVVALVATFLFFTAKSNCVYADQTGDLLQVVVTLMTTYGFENVRAFILSDTLDIEYENRVYLREKDAIRVIIPKLMNTVPNIQTLRLIPKRDNVPLFQITISRDDYQESIANKLNADGKTIGEKYAIRDDNQRPGSHRTLLAGCDEKRYAVCFGNAGH